MKKLIILISLLFLFSSCSKLVIEHVVTKPGDEEYYMILTCLYHQRWDGSCKKLYLCEQDFAYYHIDTIIQKHYDKLNKVKDSIEKCRKNEKEKN